MPRIGITPRPGMIVSAPVPLSDYARELIVIIVTLPETNVNVETGAPCDELVPSLAPHACYELSARRVEWSNLTYAEPERDEAFLDPDDAR